MTSDFVSGLYRPDEDAANAPRRSIQQICDDALRGRIRNRQRRPYLDRRTLAEKVGDRKIDARRYPDH